MTTLSLIDGQFISRNRISFYVINGSGMELADKFRITRISLLRDGEWDVLVHISLGVIDFKTLAYTRDFILGVRLDVPVEVEFFRGSRYKFQLIGIAKIDDGLRYSPVSLEMEVEYCL